MFRWAIFVLASATTFVLHAETVTVMSGNGSIGQRDSAVTFLIGPPTGDILPNPLPPADFSECTTRPGCFHRQSERTLDTVPSSKSSRKVDRNQRQCSDFGKHRSVCCELFDLIPIRIREPHN